MSDQMPDEVWLERPRWDGWGEYTTKRVENPRVHRVRYIRADLCEQAEAERDDAKARVEHLLTEICGGAANRHALAERCREVTAERDRLRGEACSALNAFSGERDKVHVMQSDIEVLRGQRDRLRAAVSEAKRRIGIYMDDECSYDETLEMGRFVLDAFHGLQEALNHD